MMWTAVIGFKALLMIGGFCHAHYLTGILSLNSTRLTPESLAESLWTFMPFTLGEYHLQQQALGAMC